MIIIIFNNNTNTNNDGSGPWEFREPGILRLPAQMLLQII